MAEETFYAIGEVSKACGVSQRTLRYYEEIGLIQPDRIREGSGYRYYRYDTMRRVQMIRYLSSEGFSLEEIERILQQEGLSTFREMLREKICKTEKTIGQQYRKIDSMRKWQALLAEGEWVRAHRGLSVTASYVPRQHCLIYRREMEQMDACTEYTNAAKRGGQPLVGIAGAICVSYSDLRLRMAGEPCPAATLSLVPEEDAKEYPPEHVAQYGGFTAVSCYHLGSLDSVGETYEKMTAWARQYAFSLRGDCYERYVLDGYSAPEEAEYVTQLLLPAVEDVAALEACGGAAVRITP